MYLGVDIGGTAVKLGLVNEVGTIQSSNSYVLNFDNYKTPIMNTVIKSIYDYIKLYNINMREVKGIGVSATGQIDTQNGTVIGGNIQSWIDVNIKKQVEDEFHIHTTVINDANAMIIGESWIGAAKGKSEVVGITIGTGVGGGILVDGNILLGSRGIAGELGHFSIQTNGIDCVCGNKGCYERYASTTALIHMVKCKYDQLDITEEKDRINGRFIFEYAQQGDQRILSIMNEWLDYISFGLVSLVHIFNPEIIVVGGAVCQQTKLFMEPLKEKIMANVMPKFKQLEITAATLKNDAGLVGAVYYNLQHPKDF